MDPGNSNLSQSKYVISLDAIDLNLIPTTFSRYTGMGVTQIWTKRNLDLRENEYFEFEIKEKDSEYNDIDDENIQYDYTTCHICNIEVPKPYLKDHFGSKKHKTYKKIIDVSLDRLQKVINKEKVFEDTNISDSVYFCSSCVAVVKIDEKILHQKTLTHKNSLMVDKILNDFLDLYDNDDIKYNNDIAVNNYSNKTNNTDDVKETKTTVDDKKGHEKIDIVEDCINLQLDIYEKIVYAAVIPGSMKNLHAYIDFLKTATHLKNVIVSENNYLEINTFSGIRVKISADNFNGIKKETIINRCILCRNSFAKDLYWEHLYEKQHVDLILKPFFNENCIRNIDASWSHCAICNIEVQNYNLHITIGEDHRFLLKEAICGAVIDIIKNISENLNSISSEIVYETVVDKIETPNLIHNMNNNAEIDAKPMSVVPEAKKNLQAYIEFLLHTTKLKNIKIAHTNMLEITTVSGIKVKIFEHNFNGLERIKKSTMKCKLCQNIFYKYMKWDHLYEKNHLDLVSIPFKNRNCIREITTDLSHCALCNTCTSNQALHITLDEKHKLHLNRALQIDIDNVTSKAPPLHQATNLLNALTRNNGEDQVASTSKTENNKIETNILTIPIKEPEFCNEKKSCSCEKCGMNVPDENGIHVRTHKIDEDLEKSQIHYLMSITDSAYNLLCKVCKTMILNNDIKVEQHLKSIYHTVNYKKMLEINNINEVVKNRFHCKSCEVGFVKTKEIIHINSKQHDQNQMLFSTEIQANPLPDMVLLKCENDIINDNSFRCIICNTMVPNHNYNIYTHLMNALHVKAATKLSCHEVTNVHYHIDLTNYPKLSCMVCNVQLTMNQNNILTHVRGNTHKNTYKLTLKNNKVVKLNDGYTCKLCDVSLAPMNELIHCYIKKHKKLLTEYQNNTKKDVESKSKILNETQTNEIKTYLLKDFKANPNELFCVVCNAKVPKTVGNINEHLKGFNHGSLYNSMLEENNIVKCCDDFECKLCQMVIVTGNEYSHISTKLHQDKMKDATKYECFICKVKLSKNDENIRLHNIGEQHMRMVELATQNDIRIYNDKCFCEICEKVLENESVNEHLKNKLHIMSSYFQDK